MSWSDGQHDGKLHLWGFVPIRRPGEARWTAGRPVKMDNVFYPCRHRCHWRCAPNVLLLELRTVLPGPAGKPALGLYPEGTIIVDPYGCRLHFMPDCLQEVQ